MKTTWELAAALQLAAWCRSLMADAARFAFLEKTERKLAQVRNPLEIQLLPQRGPHEIEDRTRAAVAATTLLAGCRKETQTIAEMRPVRTIVTGKLPALSFPRLGI